eukprot:scaffold17809_cov193-Skeletonema_marinoi.AAC.1
MSSPKQTPSLNLHMLLGWRNILTRRVQIRKAGDVSDAMRSVPGVIGRAVPPKSNRMEWIWGGHSYEYGGRTSGILCTQRVYIMIQKRCGRYRRARIIET